MTAKGYGDNLQALTWPEFDAACAAFWLTPATICTEKDFFNMLECLPPENWTNIDNIESFTMIEMTSGAFTQQYACRNGQYICKMVDITNHDTWITHADFDGLA